MNGSRYINDLEIQIFEINLDASHNWLLFQVEIQRYIYISIHCTLQLCLSSQSCDLIDDTLCNRDYIIPITNNNISFITCTLTQLFVTPFIYLSFAIMFIHVLFSFFNSIRLNVSIWLNYSSLFQFHNNGRKKEMKWMTSIKIPKSKKWL